MEKKGLSLNASKSEILIFGLSQTMTVGVQLESQNVSFSVNSRYLGLPISI